LGSEYTISVKTWRGNQIELLNACILTPAFNYKWIGLSTGFDSKIGESINTVKFDKLKNIQFKEEGKSKALMITNSGKTVDVTFDVSYNYENLWLGGNWEKFGPSRIQIQKVASLEISKTVKQ